MSELLKNPIFTAIISAILSILAYLINNKIKNVENNNEDIMKMGLLGGCLGLFNGSLMYALVDSTISIKQDFMTGTPNF